MTLSKAMHTIHYSLKALLLVQSGPVIQRLLVHGCGIAFLCGLVAIALLGPFSTSASTVEHALWYGR